VANEEIRKDLPFVRKEVSRDEALQLRQAGEKLQDRDRRGHLQQGREDADALLARRLGGTSASGRMRLPREDRVIKLLSVAGAYLAR